MEENKVDLSQAFKGLDGKPIKLGDKEITLGKTIAESLSVPLEEDKNLGPDQVVKRWKLAMLCYDEGKQTLSPEDKTLIRARITKTHMMIVAAQVCEMLT